jgi:hypothetical protein
MEMIPIQVHQFAGCVSGAAAKRVGEGKEQDGMMMVLPISGVAAIFVFECRERVDGCCDGSL